MPHSSGGGSHGGGFHSGGGGGGYSRSSGGGSSSGSSADFSNTRLSRKPYRGSCTYCYYKNNKPVYVYSSYDAKTHKTTALDIVAKIILFIILAPMFLALSGWSWMESFSKPKKLSPPSSKDIIIEDNADIIGSREEKELKNALKDFYKETGIVPAVVTINNEEWQKDGEQISFTTVAYNAYVDRFKDEKHWLILYSEPEDPDPGFNDWYWEGMQGDDTDDILTLKKTDKFTEDLHDNFLNKKISVGEAITMSFNKLTPGVMKSEFNGFSFVFFILSTAGFVWFTIWDFNIHPIRKSILKKSFKCKESMPKTEECEYCGGTYLIGYHLSCPFCGAALKAHSYTTDADGRVVSVIE